MEITEIVKTCEICGEKTEYPIIVEKTGGNYRVKAYICSKHFKDFKTWMPQENKDEISKVVTRVEFKALELRVDEYEMS